MADTAISALSTDSAPARTADYLPTYDASAGATKKVLLNNVGVITYMMYISTNTSPADSTSYAMSAFAGFGLVTTFANNKMYVQRAGVITRIRLFGICTAGTAENVTVAFRLNDTTDTTITSTLQLNATPFTAENTALSIAVADGDYFGIKVTTPAFVTNPTNFNIYALVYQS